VENLSAIVEAVAVTDVRVKKEIWGIIKSEIVVGRKKV
jgi:hypothetical protein